MIHTIFYPPKLTVKAKSTLRFLLAWFMISLIFSPITPVSAQVKSVDLESRIFFPIIANGSSETSPGPGPGYYISPGGNDINPGSLNLPWRTIGKAARTVKPGDTVYVRGGVYSEAISLNVSGTASNPILFIAYPGETAVIDGNNQLPSTWTALLYVQGDYVRVSGFEVRNSGYLGVQLHGKHDWADHIYAHHNQRNGIYIQGDYGTVEDSRIWQNALVNKNNQLGNGSSALTTARDAENGTTDYAVLRNNTVWENWAIGIDSYESNGTTIVGNTVHDNLIGNLYISDATNIVCDGNFIYMTPGNVMYGADSNFGILLGDELYTPPSANITIVNNIAYGNNFNLKWYSGVQGGGMKNVLIAHNTLVNNMPNQQGNRNIDIGKGTHQNVRILNNIIVQQDSQAIEDIADNSQIVLSNNVWSKTASTKGMGTNSIVADPKLAKTGTPYTVDWFKLTSGSPAIHRAPLLPEASLDFFRIQRGSPTDDGAIEYH